MTNDTDRPSRAERATEALSRHELRVPDAWRPGRAEASGHEEGASIDPALEWAHLLLLNPRARLHDKGMRLKGEPGGQAVQDPQPHPGALPGSYGPHPSRLARVSLDSAAFASTPLGQLCSATFQQGEASWPSLLSQDWQRPLFKAIQVALDGQVCWSAQNPQDLWWQLRRLERQLCQETGVSLPPRPTPPVANGIKIEVHAPGARRHVLEIVRGPGLWLWSLSGGELDQHQAGALGASLRLARDSEAPLSKGSARQNQDMRALMGAWASPHESGVQALSMERRPGELRLSATDRRGQVWWSSWITRAELYQTMRATELEPRPPHDALEHYAWARCHGQRSQALINLLLLPEFEWKPSPDGLMPQQRVWSGAQTLASSAVLGEERHSGEIQALHGVSHPPLRGLMEQLKNPGVKIHPGWHQLTAEAATLVMVHQHGEHQQMARELIMRLMQPELRAEPRNAPKVTPPPTSTQSGHIATVARAISLLERFRRQREEHLKPEAPVTPGFSVRAAPEAHPSVQVKDQTSEDIEREIENLKALMTSLRGR